MGKSLVIVGASYAGVHLAAAAREQGFDGRIVLIGEERQAPYQRPPLSKGFLTGRVETHSLALKSDAFYAEERIELLTGRRAVAIDRSARSVLLNDDSRIAYDFLALTTGARCRQLDCEGSSLAGVHMLRSLDDAVSLARASNSARRILVIGGGFIGLEVAAALRTLGKEICVIETQDRLLARVAPPVMSQFLQDYHARGGIEFVLGTNVARLQGSQGHVTGAELADGRIVHGDLVLVAIGVVPNVELAEACGLAVRNGIVVDQFARTQDPAIVAAGDCARYPNPWSHSTEDVRLESIQSANDLARIAASTVVGTPKPYAALPWFWSDQGDLKLQMAGLSIGWDRLVVRGVVQSARFSIFYFKGSRLLGVDTVNHPAEHMQARKLLSTGASIADAPLENTDFSLKSLMQPPAADAKV